ncbi:THUMP-like domain-containing protein [Altibacter sp. HG106]|uniref:THUMP-like domain-containing protein n=1 Tax=Altibacter sp. HG106 TaxID=3023937 RepID=UPI0023506566|nr:class I SAM-dependent methyltransferase [Altibacter sp. HG106]MDC7993477.1 class I SAM-dependent methyltransferase [Altibacter sp. HG106]
MSFSEALLDPDVQQFIHEFDGDISALAFSGSPFPELSIQEVLQQIEGRRRIEKKLPTWFHTRGILYPPRVNLEQTSSEETARYKASLIKANSIADLTAGWGVDSYYFSKAGMVTTAFERDSALTEISRHNATVLQATQLSLHCNEGLQGIENLTFEAIYIDPSRRHDTKGKVFYLEDCEPNVPKHLDYLMQRCETLWVKTSPMLDLHVGLQSLKCVSEIHIVAVKNEVKELLWKIEHSEPKTPQIVAINLQSEYDHSLRFEFYDRSEANYASPDRYLYEPNAALLKAGVFHDIARRFNVQKLAAHTHLYTHRTLIAFPGRRFKITQQLPYSKQSMRALSALGKAHITTRNFPESVAVLRKKWKLKDGGNNFLFFTTLASGKRSVLVCEKV